jgi:hypothetical protein
VTTVVTVAALAAACTASPVAIALVGRAIWRRAERADHVAQVAEDIYPQAVDVVVQQDIIAEAEAIAMSEEMCVLLDEALAHLRAVRA